MSCSIFTHTDVTAVKLYRDFIYAGIGSFLSSYEKSSGYFVRRMACLNGQKIYGIVHNTDGFKIVFGGKQFTILEAADGQMPTEITSRRPLVQTCTDWLHSAVWIGPGHTVALLTAHNVVQIWNIERTINTFESQHPGKDNSILYSGLLVNLDVDDVLVLAGTVFSEVIIRLYRDDEALHRLKGHKGVIFSITCDLGKELIVTTSDDRSVRIWGRNNVLSSSSKTTEYWRDVDIVCKHELYGHTARVMRSCITDNYVVSVGEDSRICLWDHKGALHKKLTSHQNGGIWSVHSEGDCLVTGGGDGAVHAHPIGLSPNSHKSQVLSLDIGKPKQIAFSARHNLFILNENNEFFHYNFEAETLTNHKLSTETTYYLLNTSSCKQMCTVTGRKLIHMFIEICKGQASTISFYIVRVDKTIYAAHWAGNRHLVVSTDGGLLTVLTVNDQTGTTDTTFVLPPCKERWLTCAGIDVSGHVFVVGDRCGGIHLFRKGVKPPVKSFHKLHGRYGPNSLMVKDNVVITTGRDRTIKYFKINESNITHTSTKELDFHWVEKFIDKEENIVCGFKEKMFVVFNLRKNSKILEVECGGGHRSWDALRYFEKIGEKYEEFIQFLYLKNSNINIATYQVSNVFAKNIVHGSHSAEINCLQSHQFDVSSRLVFSGGEDTTMRVSALTEGEVFECYAVCKQLSSVRTLRIYVQNSSNYIVFSAGGRAQICIRSVKVEDVEDSLVVKTEDLVDFMLKGTDKERRGNQNWRDASIDFNPETRIMDLDYIKTRNKFIIFAGCSDASLRVFTFKQDKQLFKMIKESKYHSTCILKTVCIHFQETDILITCTTRGEVALWDAKNATEDSFEPFFVMKTNKSGINSVAYKGYDDRLLIVTGGDDNAIHLNVLQVLDPLNLNAITVTHSLVLDKYHSSAITGLCLFRDVILSASIDQRVTMFSWKIADTIECSFINQLLSDIADIHGMELIDTDSSSVSVCVFGKGMEVLRFVCEP